MSYQERTNNVSLISSLLIMGFYLLNVYQIAQGEGLNSINVFSLWGTVIVLSIFANIVAHIITSIVFNILYAIATKENKEEPTFADERDKLIELKGTRNAYYVFVLGVVLSMATLVINTSPLVMFSLLMFFLIVAEIVGGFSRLYLYRRGF